MQHRDGNVRRCVTLNLTTTFIATARTPLIRAVGLQVNISERMSICRGQVLDSNGDVCVSGQGHYRYMRGHETVEGVPAGVVGTRHGINDAICHLTWCRSGTVAHCGNSDVARSVTTAPMAPTCRFTIMNSIPTTPVSDDVLAWTEDARRYGFHATLKPPFALKARHDGGRRLMLLLPRFASAHKRFRGQPA